MVGSEVLTINLQDDVKDPFPVRVCECCGWTRRF